MSYDLSDGVDILARIRPLRRTTAEALTTPTRARRSPKLRTVYLNGKFYVGAVNGVHRAADRLIRELDALNGAGVSPGLDLRLLLPKRANWAPSLPNICKVPQAAGHNQVWEQLLLPMQAAGGVLVNLANLAPLMHTRKLSMIHDAQFVISPESFPPRFRLGYKILTPLIAASSARVLTVSEYSRDSLAAFRIARHEKTDVVYNGADHILNVEPDTSVLDRLCLRRPYALLFGNTATYKNVQVVFEAFNHHDPGVQLVVLGAPRAAFLDAGMQPPPNAVFAGQVQDGELRALYERAMCLLFPSRTEGFGLPPVEAMTCGCPVIVAPAGALPEICRDAVLYADIFSPEDWIGQIRTLRTCPELRQAKVEAGLRRAARFTWRAAAQSLLQKILCLASA